MSYYYEKYRYEKYRNPNPLQRYYKILEYTRDLSKKSQI